MRPKSRTAEEIGTHPEPFDRTVNVVAASITALRSGPVAPVLVWSPMVVCRWRLRVVVSRSPQDVFRDVDGFGWSPECDVGRPAATIVVIEHGVEDLAKVLVDLGGRPVRLMAWTPKRLGDSGPPVDSTWTRITVDELFYLTSRRLSDRWVSVLASAILTPLVEASDPPPTR